MKTRRADAQPLAKLLLRAADQQNERSLAIVQRELSEEVEEE